jgi:hypothetical protein
VKTSFFLPSGLKVMFIRFGHCCHLVATIPVIQQVPLWNFRMCFVINYAMSPIYVGLFAQAYRLVLFVHCDFIKDEVRLDLTWHLMHEILL